MRIFCLVLVLLPALLRAQIVPGRYVVELEEEPTTDAAVRSRVQSRVRQRLQQFPGARVVGSTRRLLNTLVVEGADPAVLQSMPGVRRIYPVVTVRADLDHALDLHRIPEAWNLIGGAANQGAGMRIAMLDTGIDITHPGFSDAGMKAPDGFPKASSAEELANTNGKVIVAKLYAPGTTSTRDVKGHGTSTAMVAVGRTNTGPAGPLTGVAPKAWIGNYKVLNDAGSGPSDAIMRAIDDAVADGMDVINLSLGSFPALAPENDVLVRAVERAVAAGVIVVAAAGNAGPDPATVESPGTARSAITVGNSGNERQFSSYVRIGSNAAVLARAGDAAQQPPVVRATVLDSTELDPAGSLCEVRPAEASLKGAIVLVSGGGGCSFEHKLLTAEAAGALAAIIYNTSTNGAAEHITAGSSRLPSVSVSNSDGMLLREQMREAPGSEVTVAIAPAPLPANAARVSLSSSRGPDSSASLKPDLLAVGMDVYTAGPMDSGGWRVVSGTSLASPMVAGAAALLKAARPGLTVLQYRSLLVNSSVELSANPAEPMAVQSAGAGRLNAAAAMLTNVVAAPATVTFGRGTSSGDFDTHRALTLSNLGTAEDTFSVEVLNYGNGPAPELSSNSVSLAPGASTDIAVRFSATSLPAGSYGGLFVIRSSTSSAEARVPWWAGVASDQVSSLAAVAPQSQVGTSATAVIYVRPTDASGFPVDLQPEASVGFGGGTIQKIERSGVFPGFYAIQVRTGPERGTNGFAITAGGLTKTVSIAAN